MAPEIEVCSIDELVVLRAAQDKFPVQTRASPPTWG